MTHAQGFQRRERDGRIAVSTDLVTVGRHEFPDGHPEWSRVNALGPSPIMAFSKTPIEASFELEAPVMLTPAVVATPPATSHYVRSPRSERGHSAVWCSFNDPKGLAEAIAHHRPEAMDDPTHPFGRTAVPTSPLLNVLARRVTRAAIDNPGLCDPLEIDESVVLIASVLSERLPEPQRGRARAPSRSLRDAVNSAAEALTLRFDCPPSLAELADKSDLSPAYLCRAFGWVTGISMSEYVGLVRLAEAADLLQDPRCSIARIAYSCGYSSHAHFTSSCQKRLGVTPSSIRRAHRGSLRDMLKMIRLRTCSEAHT